jgi:ferric-dicitrate binding protein FerR (iron transport regulator)
MKPEHDDYLWDRSGEPDRDVEHLEAILAPLRYRRQAPPAVPAAARTTSRLRRFALPAGIAASLCLAAAAAAWIWVVSQSGWWVQRLAGTPIVEGEAVASTGRLHRGQWLVTDGAAQARLAIGRIGSVIVAPNSRVQLVEAQGREHRIALERGTIHARIWAPPKFFFVDTPSAVAVDLGCAYTLTVDDRGRGVLRVTEGWVALEHEGRESYVPQGAAALTIPGAPPGTPRYDDAPAGYAAALATIDFGGLENPLRGEAFGLVLSTARRRDALTLWHMLSRGTAAERASVYDRLASLATPPPAATREAVLSGDQVALDRWWDSLGIHDRRWWKFWGRTPGPR